MRISINHSTYALYECHLASDEWMICQVTRLRPIIPASQNQQSFLCFFQEAFLRPPRETNNNLSVVLDFPIKLHA